MCTDKAGASSPTEKIIHKAFQSLVAKIHKTLMAPLSTINSRLVDTLLLQTP